MKRKSGKEVKIVFADQKIYATYMKLEKSNNADERKLFEWISRAIDDLKENPFYGIQIQKKMIPKEYFRKYGIDNLWMYDLPQGWRLIYMVVSDEVHILSVILEWFDHKDYERRFGY